MKYFCGDLCQLPPVRAKHAFNFNGTETMEGFISLNLWYKFRLVEFHKEMREDDEMFVRFLNKRRVGDIDQNLEGAIIEKMILIIQVIFCIFLQKKPHLIDTMTIN